MTEFFFAFGHFVEWLLKPIVAANWSGAILFVIVLVLGAAYWLFLETRYTRKAKENDEFI